MRVLSHLADRASRSVQNTGLLLLKTKVVVSTTEWKRLLVEDAKLKVNYLKVLSSHTACYF